jgi:hypothetical protein
MKSVAASLKHFSAAAVLSLCVFPSAVVSAQHLQGGAENADGWPLPGDARRARGDSDGAQAAYTRAAQIAPEYASLPRPKL